MISFRGNLSISESATVKLLNKQKKKQVISAPWPYRCIHGQKMKNHENHHHPKYHKMKTTKTKDEKCPQAIN